MKIVLSSNIDHYKYTAHALQRTKKSTLFICAAFFKKLPWFYKYSRGYKKWIENRLCNELDHNKIQSFISYELIYKLIRNNSNKLFISPDSIDKIFNLIFDFYTLNIVSKVEYIDIFHYVSGIGYHAARKVKENHQSIIIVDDRAEHKEYLYNILKEEYKLAGKEFNDSDFWKVDSRRDYFLADYIITPSTFAKETFIKQGVDERKLMVIPYGCSVDKFYPIDIDLSKKGNKFKVIYVGSLCLRKGVHYLLDAFKKIDNSNIELLIIGRIDPDLEDIIDLNKANITHIPYVPNNELNYYYSLADVFILPSLSDSFSLATLEAMAAGLPVIVSENVGAKDFINQDNGIIIPIKDQNAIIESIMLLYNDENLRKKMSNNARKTALSITWDTYEQNIIDFYNHITEGS